MTPPVLIDILLSCLQVELPYWGVLFAGLVIACIVFGSLSVRERSEVQP